MELATRKLTAEADGIPGYMVAPVREGKGPALLLIHQHSGLTGYLKTEAYKFAKLGYTTVIPNLYHLLGYPALTHIDTGTEIQNKTCDEDFVRVIDQGWKFLLARGNVDPLRVGVAGYCMGGRIGIHFVAATPEARAFVAYYPSVRDEASTKIRPRHPCDAAREIKCPSMVLYGGLDGTSTIPVQQRVQASFLENGQPLEWHFSPMAITASPQRNPTDTSRNWPSWSGPWW